MSVLGPIVFISTFVTFCSVLCKDKTNTQANLITSVNSAWLLAKIGKGYSARIRHAHGKTLSHSVNSAWHLAQIGKVYSGRTSFPPTAVFPPCLCLFLYYPDQDRESVHDYQNRADNIVWDMSISGNFQILHGVLWLHVFARKMGWTSYHDETGFPEWLTLWAIVAFFVCIAFVSCICYTEKAGQWV